MGLQDDRKEAHQGGGPREGQAGELEGQGLASPPQMPFSRGPVLFWAFGTSDSGLPLSKPM